MNGISIINGNEFADWMSEVKKRMPDIQGHCRYYFEGQESRFHDWYQIMVHSDDIEWLKKIREAEVSWQEKETHEAHLNPSILALSQARKELCDILLAYKTP